VSQNCYRFFHLCTVSSTSLSRSFSNEILNTSFFRDFIDWTLPMPEFRLNSRIQSVWDEKSGGFHSGTPTVRYISNLHPADTEAARSTSVSRYANFAGFADTSARKMTYPLRSRMARPYRLWSDLPTRKLPFTTHSSIANSLILLQTSIRSYICSKVVWAQVYSRCQWPFATPVSPSVFSPLSSLARSAPIVSTSWSSPPTFSVDDRKRLA